MKYLNYIMNETPVQPEQLGVAGVPIGIVAIPVLAFMFCGASLMDLNRLLRLRYLEYLRRRRRIMHIEAVLLSLDAEITKSNVLMLLAA